MINLAGSGSGPDDHQVNKTRKASCVELCLMGIVSAKRPRRGPASEHKVPLASAVPHESQTFCRWEQAVSQGFQDKKKGQGRNMDNRRVVGPGAVALIPLLSTSKSK
jgi:hypothetical protein